MTFQAGQIPTAAQLNASLPQLARGFRTTASTGSTGVEVGFLRLDAIPITSGLIYRIDVSPLRMSSTVAADVMAALLRASTSGAATTASTLLTTLSEATLSGAVSVQRSKGMSVLYPAVVSGALSVLLSLNRLSGTGTCTIEAAAAVPAQLSVSLMGTDPGDTGVSI